MIFKRSWNVLHHMSSFWKLRWGVLRIASQTNLQYVNPCINYRLAKGTRPWLVFYKGIFKNMKCPQKQKGQLICSFNYCVTKVHVASTTPLQHWVWHQPYVLLRLSVEWGATKCARGLQVLMLKLCCCHGQLAPFPVATYRPLTS